MEYKDKVGRVIELGDILVIDKASYRGLEIGIALGWTPTMVRTSRGLESSENTMVITEQLYSSGRSDLVDELRSKYADKIDATAPRKQPIQKWRYNAFLVQSDDKSALPYVLVLKCDGNSLSSMRKSVGEGFKHHGVVTKRMASYQRYTALSLKYDRTKRAYTGEYAFQDSYNAHEKGLAFKVIKDLGLENCVDKLTPLDQFKVDFPKIGFQ